MSIPDPIKSLPDDAQGVAWSLYNAVNSMGVEVAALIRLARRCEDPELLQAYDSASGHTELAVRALQDAYCSLYNLGMKRAKEESKN